MGFVITYKPLFEVRLLHHYHLDKAGAGSDYTLFDLATAPEQEKIKSRYDIASFLQIAPTAACADILKKHQCIFRRLEDHILILAKVQFDTDLGKYVPFVPLADDLCFSFRYSITDPDFMNYTNLPMQRDNNSIFYFRNRKEAGARAYPSLSRAAATRDVNVTYDAGEILLSADASTVLIAEGITGPADTPAQNFTEDIKVNSKALAYVNRNDLVRSSGNLLVIDTGLQERREHITVQVKDDSGTVVTPRVAIIDNTNTLVQLDFSFFPEGLYRIHVEDAVLAFAEDTQFYLQKESLPCDGILQLQVKSDDASFSLLNSNKSIREGNQMRSFELRFKNRATVWRYLGKNFSHQPESGPFLLARNGFVSLTIDDEHADPVTDPPNASMHMIRAERPVAAPVHYNLVSEIYLNT